MCVCVQPNFKAVMVIVMTLRCGWRLYRASEVLIKQEFVYWHTPFCSNNKGIVSCPLTSAEFDHLISTDMVLPGARLPDIFSGWRTWLIIHVSMSIQKTLCISIGNELYQCWYRWLCVGSVSMLIQETVYWYCISVDTSDCVGSVRVYQCWYRRLCVDIVSVLILVTMYICANTGDYFMQHIKCWYNT